MRSSQKKPARSTPPSAPGERIGKFRLGKDDLITEPRATDSDCALAGNIPWLRTRVLGSNGT